MSFMCCVKGCFCRAEYLVWRVEQSVKILLHIFLQFEDSSWQTDRALAVKLVLSRELQLSWCRTLELIRCAQLHHGSQPGLVNLRIRLQSADIGQNNIQVDFKTFFISRYYVFSPHGAAVQTTLWWRYLKAVLVLVGCFVLGIIDG